MSCKPIQENLGNPVGSMSAEGDSDIISDNIISIAVKKSTKPANMATLWFLVLNVIRTV